MMQAPVLFGAEAEVDNLDVSAIVALICQQDVFWFQIPVDDVTGVHIRNTFEQTVHDSARLKVAQLLWLAFIVLKLVKALELASWDQLHLENDELLVLKYALERDDGRVVH